MPYSQWLGASSCETELPPNSTEKHDCPSGTTNSKFERQTTPSSKPHFFLGFSELLRRLTKQVTFVDRCYPDAARLEVLELSVVAHALKVVETTLATAILVLTASDLASTFDESLVFPWN